MSSLDVPFYPCQRLLMAVRSGECSVEGGGRCRETSEVGGERGQPALQPERDTAADNWLAGRRQADAAPIAEEVAVGVDRGDGQALIDELVLHGCELAENRS